MFLEIPNAGVDTESSDGTAHLGFAHVNSPGKLKGPAPLLGRGVTKGIAMTSTNKEAQQLTARLLAVTQQAVECDAFGLNAGLGGR